jgi:hypothetical protein
MSIVVPTSVGNPGDTITATNLNSAFTSFTNTLEADNLRVDCLQNRHLSLSYVNGPFGAAKNTSSSLTTYSGNTYQAVTHGTALTTPSIILLDKQTLRVHWHQYVDEIIEAVPGALNEGAFTAFALEWDIGAGYTSIPDLLVWSCSGVGRTGIATFDNRYAYNMTGSWCYHNGTGSAINIAGIKLTVKPCSYSAAGSVKLGEGTIFTVVQGRS